ncbi:MAG: hypothetical protein WBI63_03920 [Coriobacteriia bacterium]
MQGQEIPTGVPVEADSPQHAIVLLTNDSSGGSTQYILTDITRLELEQGMRGSQLAMLLDIQNDDQVAELFSSGTTHTFGAMGRKQTVTIEWCTCDDPASHNRDRAAQLGL